jgi:hypothetical protein
VDDAVDLAELLADARHDLLHLRAVGDVGAVDLDARA